MTECIFCKMVEGKIPVEKIYESDDVLVFPDIHPQAKVHLLVIPKKHLPNVLALDDQTSAAIMNAVKKAVELKHLNEKGFRLVANTGEHGGQTVFHLHFHLLGGRHLGWPPG